jgi:hypothetical protein
MSVRSIRSWCRRRAGLLQSRGKTFMALAGRPWMDETPGCRPLTLVTLIAAASAKVRLALEPRGTLDCRYEHESQSL